VVTVKPKPWGRERVVRDSGPRVNEKIRAREIRLIGAEGEQLGIFVLQEALRRAEADGLDLVEVAPTAEPPVCRIMDYGKFKFQKQKRDHEARKKQTVVQLKELKLRPKIKDHDLETKVKHARRFLEHGNKVKVSVFFRYRELAHPEFGKEILDRVKIMIADVGQVESESKMKGRNMIMILAPKGKHG